MNKNKIYPDKALVYERIIRKIYNCDRFQRDAADADVYRTLVRADERERYASLMEITQYLKDAIQKMQKDSFTKEQQDLIEQIKSLLAQPTVDKVVEVIEILEGLIFQK